LKLFFLFLGIVSGDSNPALHLIKIPISTEIKRISCEQAFEKYTTWNPNPHYTEGNGEVWGYMAYKDKPVILHYCKNKNGGMVTKAH